MRSFPNLEYLEITVLNDDEDDGCIVESLELERFSDVTFNHLRQVKLGRFTGTTTIMQLIKLLLAKSPVLVRMVIDTWLLYYEPVDTRLNALAEITTKLWRASPQAKVVYINSH